MSALRMKTSVASLQGVSETALLTLYARAVETRRPDGLLRDPTAVALAERIDYPFHRFDGLATLDVCAVRAAEMDRRVAAFLNEHPTATVVQLGIGLNTRHFRLNAPRATWINVDFAPVMRLRRDLIEEPPNVIDAQGSAFGAEWMEAVPDAQPLMVVAEGVLYYAEPSQVREWFVRVIERFPAATFLFDTIPPLISRWASFHEGLRAVGIRQPMPWGVSHPRAIASWHPGIANVSHAAYMRETTRGRWFGALCRMPLIRRHLNPFIVQIHPQLIPLT